MPYIQRDQQNKIQGIFHNPQPGLAEEFLPENDLELVAKKAQEDADRVKYTEIKTLQSDLLDAIAAGDPPDTTKRNRFKQIYK